MLHKEVQHLFIDVSSGGKLTVFVVILPGQFLAQVVGYRIPRTSVKSKHVSSVFTCHMQVCNSADIQRHDRLLLVPE